MWVTAVVVCGDELRAGDTMRRRPSADAHCVCVIILLASRTDSSLLYTPSNSLLLLLRAVPLLPPQPQLTERAITAPAGDR